MTDISEKQTIEYFIHGIRKAKAAAKELALLNQKGDWIKIRDALDQIEKNAIKMATGKAQTREQTLALAASIDVSAATAPGRAPKAKANGLIH